MHMFWGLRAQVGYTYIHTCTWDHMNVQTYSVYCEPSQAYAAMHDTQSSVDDKICY